jgi:hypothetical protein
MKLKKKKTLPTKYSLKHIVYYCLFIDHSRPNLIENENKKI